MKFKKLIASAVAIVTGVLGLSLAAASPAAAATGVWRAFGDVSPITGSSAKWACGATKSVTTDVFAQVCAIRSNHGTGDSVQAAVIVRNNRSSLYAVEAAADLSTIEGFVSRWECSRSWVATDSWSVCFGETLNFFSLKVEARGGANGVNLPLSPTV